MTDDRFKSLGSILARSLGSSIGDLAAEASRLERLRTLWPDLLRSAAGRHSRPRLLRGNRLVIAADSPAWADRLRRQQQALLVQLRAHPDTRSVSELRIVVQPLQGSGDSTGSRGTAAPAGPRSGSTLRKSRPFRDK